MSSNKHSRYHYQENSSGTGDRYEYKKMILIQEIGTNTRKQYSFEK